MSQSWGCMAYFLAIAMCCSIDGVWLLVGSSIWTVFTLKQLWRNSPVGKRSWEAAQEKWGDLHPCGAGTDGGQVSPELAILQMDTTWVPVHSQLQQDAQQHPGPGFPPLAQAWMMQLVSRTRAAFITLGPRAGSGTTDQSRIGEYHSTQTWESYRLIQSRQETKSDKNLIVLSWKIVK